MFQPENVESWEAGIKSKWFDHSLDFNLGVFHSYFDNLQTLAIDGAFINVANAATAISQGVEMDFRWLTPLRFLNVSGSLGLLDAHYDSYPDRSEEHTSELQSLMRISYAVFCLKKKK